MIGFSSSWLLILGVCGVFSYEVAEAKATQVMDYARQNEHPLQLQIEKE